MNRQNSRGIGGPSTVSQQGETGAAAKLAGEMFPDFSKQNAATKKAAGEARKNGMMGSRGEGMMGDGKKPEGGGGKNDPQSAMADDIKAMRKTLDQRLPKGRTE